MGMSTHVIGFRPPDETWKKHKAVYDACIKAGVEVPKTTFEFFNYEAPDDGGVVVKLEQHQSVSTYNDESQSGYEVDISKLPKDIKTIRFYNSW